MLRIGEMYLVYVCVHAPKHTALTGGGVLPIADAGGWTRLNSNGRRGSSVVLSLKRRPAFITETGAVMCRCLTLVHTHTHTHTHAHTYVKCEVTLRSR